MERRLPAFTELLREVVNVDPLVEIRSISRLR